MMMIIESLSSLLVRRCWSTRSSFHLSTPLHVAVAQIEHDDPRPYSSRSPVITKIPLLQLRSTPEQQKARKKKPGDKDFLGPGMDRVSDWLVRYGAQDAPNPQMTSAVCRDKEFDLGADRVQRGLRKMSKFYGERVQRRHSGFSTVTEKDPKGVKIAEVATELL